MSTPAESRPLSLRPFLAADGVLLLTALLVAWRTSDELRGGALLAVVFCSGLGAVLMILPFVINEVRRRESELAARQRELAELVNTANANTSRWGAQWTAAATGLEDAASLATRSLAAAERLPALFEEQVATFADRLARADADACERESIASAREARAVERERRVEAREVALAAREDAFAARATALVDRLEQGASSAATLERSLAVLERAESAFRDRQVELNGTVAELARLAADVRVAKIAVDEALRSALRELESRVGRAASDAEGRMSAASAELIARCAAAEAAVSPVWANVKEQLERLADEVAAVEQRLEGLAGAGALPPETPLASPPFSAVTVTQVPAGELHEKAPRTTTAGPAEAIMDPFYIPDDGYSALAEAMDGGRRS